jgi:hypothetical protein
MGENQHRPDLDQQAMDQRLEEIRAESASRMNDGLLRLAAEDVFARNLD